MMGYHCCGYVILYGKVGGILQMGLTLSGDPYQVRSSPAGLKEANHHAMNSLGNGQPVGAKGLSPAATGTGFYQQPE